MRHIKLQHFLVIVLIIFTSCNSNKHKEVEEKSTITEAASYQLDIENTKVIWNGYKTNDKIKVVGYFNEFSCDRENQGFSSIEDLVTGLKFSIKSSSSSSFFM